MDDTQKRETCAPEDRPCVLPDPAARAAGVTGRNRLTFAEAAAEAAEQIRAERLQTPYNRRRLAVILRVMADMYIKTPSTVVYIEGEPMRAGDVAEVYRSLDESAAYDVLDRLADVEMVRVKPYVRTVLYNAAIEGGM